MKTLFIDLESKSNEFLNSLKDALENHLFEISRTQKLRRANKAEIKSVMKILMKIDFNLKKKRAA